MSIEVAKVAASYLGKQETPGNSGFKDKVFQKKMEEVGWIKSQAWCTYFAELCAKEAAIEAGRKELVPLLGKLFSGSSTATYKNFDLYAKANPSGPFKVGSKPKANAIAIYRNGNSWTGHTAVVEAAAGTVATNIEGNTDSAGGREGIEVARKKRDGAKAYSSKSLNLVGYIYIT